MLATGNPHKVQEIEAILSILPLREPVEILPVRPEGEESHPTFLENALEKAREGFRKTGFPTLAEDTGLVVDILDGAPGLFSARFSGTGRSEANIQKLLSLLPGTSWNLRRAHFVCYAVYVDGKRELWARGVVHGYLLSEPRGAQGFGYDPIFLYAPLGRTFAEIPLAWKNRWSHRRRAIEHLFQQLGWLHEGRDLP